MDVLEDNVKKLKASERYCTILFDEICLSSGITYNPVTDSVDGFVDTGMYKNQNVPDHVLVFMVRGKKKKFKQPVSYSFCQGATKHDELKVHDTGLRVVATLSNQGSANVSDINSLRQETRALHIKNNTTYKNEFYEVPLENKQVLKLVYIYDVSQCIRNNLMTKDLMYDVDGIKKQAKWSHFVELYNVDSLTPDCKILPRLTDQHMKKLKK
ncbi:hypothetical protein QTP88_011027 [Uroleucon formosanum]